MYVYTCTSTIVFPLTLSHAFRFLKEPFGTCTDTVLYTTDGQLHQSLEMKLKKVRGWKTQEEIYNYIELCTGIHRTECFVE